jgi:hypothetical protein
MIISQPFIYRGIFESEKILQKLPLRVIWYIFFCIADGQSAPWGRTAGGAKL